MSINQVTPGQGWLQTLNNDLTNLDGSVVQRTDWQLANAVFLNGFKKMDDKYWNVAVRYLKNSRGDILSTEIFGATGKDNYDGSTTDFCVLTGVPLSGRLVVGSARVDVNGMPTGIVNVGISKEDYTNHTLTLHLSGRRYESYSRIDGMISFHLIY